LTDKVFFLGFVDFAKAPEVYSEADIFIFASNTETQGMVILEAMASSLPVLAVKDRVFEDIIDDGVDGFLAKKNKDQFSKKLLALLKDDSLRSKIGSAARKKAEKYSIDEMAKRFDNLYKELI
jgi:1,2-diacylglycerol 3-alpha-glucosyltransferase